MAKSISPIILTAKSSHSGHSQGSSSTESEQTTLKQATPFNGIISSSISVPVKIVFGWYSDPFIDWYISHPVKSLSIV